MHKYSDHMVPIVVEIAFLDQSNMKFYTTYI